MSGLKEHCLHTLKPSSTTSFCWKAHCSPRGPHGHIVIAGPCLPTLHPKFSSTVGDAVHDTRPPGILHQTVSPSRPKQKTVLGFVLLSFALFFFIPWGGGWKKGSLQDRGQLSAKKTGGQDPELAFSCPLTCPLPSSSYLSTHIFSFSRFVWAASFSAVCSEAGLCLLSHYSFSYYLGYSLTPLGF